MAKGKDELIGRAVVDADFRKRLLTDPEGVIASEGYEVEPDVIEKIKQLDPDAAEAAAKGLTTDAKRKAAG
jgi:hypothetical protein